MVAPAGSPHIRLQRWRAHTQGGGYTPAPSTAPPLVASGSVHGPIFSWIQVTTASCYATAQPSESPRFGIVDLSGQEGLLLGLLDDSDP